MFGQGAHNADKLSIHSSKTKSSVYSSLVDVYRRSHKDNWSNRETSTSGIVIISEKSLWQRNLLLHIVPVLSGVISYVLSIYLMRRSKTFGIDYHKRSKVKLPESIGLACGISFVFSIFLYSAIFPIYKDTLLIFTNSIVLSILLGYVDDTLDLPWSSKILFPIVSSMPMITAYRGSRSVSVPFARTYDLGIFFYILLSLSNTYFTNITNILSGINGVESGQILVVSAAMAIDRFIFSNSERTLTISLSISLFMSTYGLFVWNKYPAKCFVGDTFCYFSGSALLCIGLFGGFTKTIFLFCLPQFINFAISTPQLFKIVPCPRHRMPSIDTFTEDKALTKVSANIPVSLQDVPVYLTYSSITLPKSYIESSIIRQSIIWIYRKAQIISYEETSESVTISNFTLLNTIVYILGPMGEEDLFKVYTYIQTGVCAAVLLIKILLSNL